MKKTKKEKVELILLNITGNDRPGVTAALSEILAKYNATILDIGQADIHHTLALGILIKTDSIKSGDLMKDLLFKSYELGVAIRFSPVKESDYTQWVEMQGKDRWIITILGRRLTAKAIAEVSREVAEQGMNIDGIKRLTGRIPLHEDDPLTKSCVQVSVRGFLKDQTAMQQRFMQIATEQQVDISLQEDSMYRRSRRLVCFDMDSTLIGTEVIDELAD
ncbi:MAG: phosphoserine phosphatase SerB, partial [Paramuribaculum sp.]|nr:phosphoserine phosphatase SerB [Paramuribaculum sp.]